MTSINCKFLVAYSLSQFSNNTAFKETRQELLAEVLLDDCDDDKLNPG